MLRQCTYLALMKCNMCNLVGGISPACSNCQTASSVQQPSLDFLLMEQPPHGENNLSHCAQEFSILPRITLLQKYLNKTAGNKSCNLVHTLQFTT